jgi:L,D-peptidoglycan transpeptidase YkuD (ErfK/YbiS/YcfS/YnhG family)
MRLATCRAVVHAASAVVVASALLAGCAGSGAGARTSQLSGEGTLSTPADGAGGRAGRSAPLPPVATTLAPGVLPGVGPQTLAEVPANARQAVLVTGQDADSATSTVRLYRYDDTAGWVPDGPSWPAHNARDGWTDDHHAGDLHSPIGVFTLTDAGGQLPDPGTKLTYDHAPVGFSVSGTGFEGEPLEGSFDYVIAIDYNRVPGTPPDDAEQPEGEDKGGGIWLHLDHGSGTSACVSLSKEAMEYLLRTLDPNRHPVVLMGDRADLKG